MIIFIKRILGYMGFNYCKYCGSRLRLRPSMLLGYDLMWECLHCSHLDRFDMSGYK